jgi:hypothetical protein
MLASGNVIMGVGIFWGESREILSIDFLVVTRRKRLGYFEQVLL